MMVQLTFQPRRAKITPSGLKVDLPLKCPGGTPNFLSSCNLIIMIDFEHIMKHLIYIFFYLNLLIMPNVVVWPIEYRILHKLGDS